MDNTNHSLAYTVSVDGIQELLTQLGQLQRSMDSGADSVSKYKDSYTRTLATLQQVTSATKTVSASNAELITATDKLKASFTSNMQDVKNSIVVAAAGYNTFKMAASEVNAMLIEQGKTMEEALGSNVDAMNNAGGQFTLGAQVVESQLKELDMAMKEIQPLEAPLISDETSKETKKNAGEISATIGQLKTQMQQLTEPEKGKRADDTLLSAIGLDKAGTAQFKQQLGNIQQAVGQSVQTLGLVFEAQKNQRLTDLQEEEDKQILQVQSSTLSEQEKAKKIAQIKKDSAAKTHEIEVDAKKQQQKLDIISSIINTALAVGKALASAPPPFNAILAAIAVAQGAAQTAVIATQKFAKGGVVPFKEGGLIEGPSHNNGGVPFMAGGRLVEAEGGELIVNRNIWRRPDFVRNISQMNSLTGGRRFFAAGGIVPSLSVPGVFMNSSQTAQPFDTATFLKGLRGVIAKEVGSLKVVNNVVDTTNQQSRIINQQANGTF